MRWAVKYQKGNIRCCFLCDTHLQCLSLRRRLSLRHRLTHITYGAVALAITLLFFHCYSISIPKLPLQLYPPFSLFIYLFVFISIHCFLHTYFLWSLCLLSPVSLCKVFIFLSKKRIYILTYIKEGQRSSIACELSPHLCTFLTHSLFTFINKRKSIYSNAVQMRC